METLFEDQFVDAPIKSEHVGGSICSPTKFDFSSRFRDDLSQSLEIRTSCRVLGVLSHASLPGRVTTMDKVYIEAGDKGDVIEFEDINFTSQVTCKRGHISFLRCRFSGPANGLSTSGDVTVTIDSCIFESNVGCGIIVGEPSLVAMRNCRIWGSGTGICIQTCGTLHAAHCCISGTGSGITMYDRGVLHWLHSEIWAARYFGISARNKSQITVRHCHIADCGHYGIRIEGRGGTYALIQDSVVEDCMCGIRTGVGKVDVEINRVFVSCSAIPFNFSEASVKKLNAEVNKHYNSKCTCPGHCVKAHHKNDVRSSDSDTSSSDESDEEENETEYEQSEEEMCGPEKDIFIDIDTVGSVIVTATTAARFVDWRGERCTVRVDDIIKSPEYVQPKHRVSMPAFYEGYECDGSHLSVDCSAARVKRYRQTLGRAVISCDHCHSIEPYDTKFRLCGACKEVRYCSPECQKRGFYMHRWACKSPRGKAHVDNNVGYWRCEQCFVSQMPENTHNYCVDCMKINYCSTECKTKHSSEHQLVCAKLKRDEKNCGKLLALC